MVAEEVQQVQQLQQQQEESMEESVLIAAKQIADLSPPDSARNSMDDGSKASEVAAEADVEMEEVGSEENVILEESRVPPVDGEEEVVVDDAAEETVEEARDGKNHHDAPATPSSLSDILSLHGGPLSPTVLALASPSLTLADAVASDKIKQRMIASAIEKYVEGRGGNLYPTRDDKEFMAKEIGVNYNQVNRWFANRRRKVTKHTRSKGGAAMMMTGGTVATTTGSAAADAAAGSAPSPAAVPEAIKERGEEKERDNVDECIDAIIEETRRRKRPAEDDLASEMVAQLSADGRTMTADLYGQEEQEVPPGSAATAAIFAAALSHGQQLSPYLLASLMSSPSLTAQLLQQVLHQQQLMAQMAHTHDQQMYVSQAAAAHAASAAAAAAAAAAAPQSAAGHHHHRQHHVVLNAHGQPTWMSPPISESPLEDLSSEDQEASSDFSQRPASPRFKDPHNIADPQMAKLLAATDLSEKESIAIAVLTDLYKARF